MKAGVVRDISAFWPGPYKRLLLPAVAFGYMYHADMEKFMQVAFLSALFWCAMAGVRWVACTFYIDKGEG